MKQIIRVSAIVTFLILSSLSMSAQTAVPKIDANNARVAETLIFELQAKVKQLTEDNATLRIKVSSLTMGMLQQQAQPILEDRAKAIKEIEGLHPGTHWDEAQGRLVTIPQTPAPAQIPAVTGDKKGVAPATAQSIDRKNAQQPSGTVITPTSNPNGPPVHPMK